MEDWKFYCPWDIFQSNVALPAWLGPRVDSSRFVLHFIPSGKLIDLSSILFSSSPFPLLLPWPVWCYEMRFVMMGYRSSRGCRSLCLRTRLIANFRWNLPGVGHRRRKSLFLPQWYIYDLSDISQMREILLLIKKPP